MSRIKTLALGSVLVFSAAIAANAASFPISPSERARVFSECAGRYSAVAEHARLFDGAASEVAEARRDFFVTLLDAVMPDALDYGLPEVQSMAWRVEAKAGHARLLSTAVFQMHRRQADNAAKAAATYIAECDQYILGA